MQQTDQPMIALDLTYRYREQVMYFALNVARGERIAIVGESGSGKSTLLNLIAGFLSGEGMLALDGNEAVSMSVADRPVAMLFQDNNLFLHLTVAENIGLGIAPTLKLKRDDQQRVAEMAAQMGIAELLPRRASTLSGGQKQRVALARTLLQNKPILLLDEPFSALDPARRIELQQLVQDLCEAHNLTLLMVTHNFDEAKAMFHRVLTIDAGRIVRDEAL